MRLSPLPLLWLLLRLGAAAPTAGPSQDAPSQLPAPRNPKIHLYNAEQALSWEPVSVGSDERPVLYRVQYKYPDSSNWLDISPPSLGVNCSRIPATRCNFTSTNLSRGFQLHFNVSLRVRAELQERTSPWVVAPWFQHYQNVTIGPPGNIRVTPGKGSLTISLSPPFDIHQLSATKFLYYVHYWEKEGPQQVKGPFENTLIELRDLKPLRVYCVQARAKLDWSSTLTSEPGLPSDTSCLETTANASTKLQQVVLIALGTFLSLIGLAGACLFLILRYRGLIKYWFHSPPGIPVQIREYLKDPAQPVLEALDRDRAPGEDAWDSVSVVSVPEE
ncbi:interferon gamma receptor 2 [Pteronotus mesoamericanus]|uniref:interferon gamma receptor 2 n=1 Tax=Pteronotus mesoamericanus TaxID=1884717 RepID=UPI0023EB01BD|nr:interferon gamma receptor 2 [Pteronotus parnellii mesoamericanus]